MQTQETNTEVQQEVKQDVQLTPEQQMESVKKVSTMQHKALSQLVRIHLADLMNDLAFKPGLSGNEKVKRINIILDSIEGVLDLGLDITKVQIPEKGAFARRTVTMSAVLTKALDNRMLLLASKLDDETKMEVKTGELTEAELTELAEMENVKTETQGE